QNTGLVVKLKVVNKRLVDIINGTEAKDIGEKILPVMSKGKRQQSRTPKPRLRPAPPLAAKLIALANSIPGKLKLAEGIELFSEGVLSDTDSKGREVELSRIRQCQICDTIFWQGRTNQICCSRRCGHILAARRYRESFSDIKKIKKEGRKRK